MALGLIGRKLGMTHVYDEFGRRRAVTAIQAGPCTVIRVREPGRDGYRALQLGFEPIDARKLTRPQAGQFTKAATGAFRHVREVRLNGAGERSWQAGQRLTVEMFQVYELVDVTGTSIGKGFQGGMKRWGWSGGPASHGSMSHRAPGAIGSTTTPGRVLRGHHLPGHMGAARVTVQHVRILGIQPEHHLLLLEGAVPGHARSVVLIRKSAKRPGLIRKPQAAQVVVEEEEEAKKPPKEKPGK